MSLSETEIGIYNQPSARTEQRKVPFQTESQLLNSDKIVNKKSSDNSSTLLNEENTDEYRRA